MARYGQKLRKLRFDRAYAPGENPNGFTAQTANGTAKATGTGWNRQFNYYYNWPQVPPGGPWQPGRSNRTGE